MARKGKAPPKADLEPALLILGGVFLFLAATLWPPEASSGELGAFIRKRVEDWLGVASLVLPLPPAYAALALWRRTPALVVVKRAGLGLLAALLILPLLAEWLPEQAGWLGRSAREVLTRELGAFWPLPPALALLVTLDLLLDKPPLYGLGSLLRLAARAAGAVRAFLQRNSAVQRLRGEARKTLREVESLLRRYPDHSLLAELAEELRAFVRRPRDPEALERWRGRLEELRRQKAEELARAIAAEAEFSPGDLDPLADFLEPVRAGGNPLLENLEERRRALALEIGALRTKAEELVSAAERARERLPGELEAEYRRHEERKRAWRALSEKRSDLARRIATWKAWVDWARSAPADALAAGLKLLSTSGLTQPPPKLRPEEEGPRERDREEAARPRKRRPAPKPKPPPPPPKGLSLPPRELLEPPEQERKDPARLEAETARMAEVINQTLAQFGLSARVVDWTRGPSVTRFEIEPAPGEKIASIQNLANDLARALAVGVVRVEAPIPGKRVVGLEVPNPERELVRFSEVLDDPEYQGSRARLPLALGKSIEGRFWVEDLAKMPHLLIAGSTGSGKSVAINALVMSLLFKHLPTELRFLMIDPKMVELTPYDGIPHLVRGVVTNPSDAAEVLMGAVAHMERRYRMMSKIGVRSLEQYNRRMREAGEPTLPYLVIVIDELADLMITSPKEVEQAILRLAQMARATGMHLILATQRPSVDILTNRIKVNIPARVAFAVSSIHDSRTILDSTGAERLIGQGDMLFVRPGLAKPVRLQGPYLSDREVRRVTDYLREQEFEDRFGEAYGADFDPGEAAAAGGPAGRGLDFRDPLLEEAARIVVEEGQGSVSKLQRRLSIGHARAGKLMDLLEAMGIVGPHRGSKPREVLISPEDLEEFFGKEG